MTTIDATDDASQRFALLELDPWPTDMGQADMGQADPDATSTTWALPVAAAPVEPSTQASIADELGLASAVAEGAHMAATAHLVRGGVLETEVDPVAGFRSADAGQRASVVTQASAQRFGQVAPGAHVAAIAAPVVSAPVVRRPLAADLSPALRDGILAARAREADLARTPAQREARARAEAERVAQATLDGAITVALRSEFGTYPHGCLVAWRPSGDVAWSTVADAARTAGVAPPAERSLRALASDAVASMKALGYRVEVVTRGSSWRVYRSAGTRVHVGESIGSAVVTATLSPAGQLDLAGPDDLCSAVRSAWIAAQAESTLTSAEVTAWIGRILSTWRAVPTCYGRWLPPTCAERWLALAGALAAAGLPVPARPAGVASRADVRDEITAGLHAEVAALVGRVETAAERATTESRRGGLGARAAATALAEIAELRGKIELYEILAGPMPEARAALAGLATTLEPICDDVSQRGAVLELDGGPTMPSDYASMDV